MNIKPKAQIGEVVKIIGCDYVQTGQKHLQSGRNGKFKHYRVEDVEATISLKTGKVKYEYLIEDENSSYMRGWVSERTIELIKLETESV